MIKNTLLFYRTKRYDFFDTRQFTNKIKLRVQMIQNSPIFHKTIYNSFSKLQKVSSDGRFRVKSLRVKTQSNQLQEHVNQKIGLPSIYNNNSQRKLGVNTLKLLSDSPNKEDAKKIVSKRINSFKAIEKNYQEQLNNQGITSQFLRKLYEIKCQQNENKSSQQRFQIFVKNLAKRLCKNRHLVLNQLGFGTKSLICFINWLIEWEGHITELDLTYLAQCLKEHKMEVIAKLLQKDTKLMHIILCNNAIFGEEMQRILNLILKRSQLFALDLSNINSQSLNRFGEQIDILQPFIKSNKSIAILRLNNTQLKKQGLQKIWKGLQGQTSNPLRILSIANNHITGSRLVGQYVQFLAKSGLIQLNISYNPLGQQFYKNLPLFKSTTIRQLDLSSTGMNSELLYDFFQRIEESKSLSVLKLDKNDFSHHWFGKIGEKLQTNNSIQFLSMNQCEIKTFMPIFQGLTQNKYLKILHLNNNTVDSQNQFMKRITDCFIYNRDLQQIKFRFCNLNQNFIIAIFDVIADNKSIKSIDISQNILQDSGAEAILKLLDKNIRIQYLGTQKLQFSQHLRSKIQAKMEENKSVRDRNELITLRMVTNQMKSADQFTWDDVQMYQMQAKNLQEKLTITQNKVSKMENMVTYKRQKLANYIKQTKAKQAQIQNTLKQRIRTQNERINNADKQIQLLQKRRKMMEEQIERQKNTINEIQSKIKNTNQHIKQRQNELQDIFRNHKYLQKKGKSKEKMQISQKRRPSMSQKDKKHQC